MTRGKAYRVVLPQHGLLAGLCALAACIPTAGNQASDASTGFCVRPVDTCTPDPGAKPVSCADVQTAETGLEFFPYSIADFEQTRTPSGSTSGTEWFGHYMYSYTDATAQVYANNNGVQSPVGYEPVATTANLCDPDQPNQPNHVLHVSGGPYLGWGGGLGVAMAHVNVDEGACLRHHDYCPPVGTEDAVASTTLNMSEWDGVAVWARRAPDSQPLLRVLVGNKYVDEDVNYEQERNGDQPSMYYCQRSRECGCTNGRPCVKWEKSDAGGDGEYYCWDPTIDSQPMTASGSAIQATNKCYTSRCNEQYPAYPGPPDPQFNNRPCTPYAFRSGVQASYCWDPDPNNHYGISDGALNPVLKDGTPDPNAIPDSPPAESDQGCGDYWTFPLELTTDWQLYLVPFTTMYQQGWAKRWPFFDTASVSVVRLTWDAGWIDYWIDNLRFYRVRR
jgi:hypothetical protein